MASVGPVIGCSSNPDKAGVAADAAPGDVGAIDAGGTVETDAPSTADGAADADAASLGTTSCAPSLSVACATALAVGAAHSCARLADGGVRCWGSNASGELGGGLAVDAAMEAGASDAAPDGRGADAAQGDGGAEAAAGGSGTDAGGRIAMMDGAADGAAGAISPIVTVDVPGAVSLAAGGLGQTGGFSCAGLADGGASCWGSNQYGQLGRAHDAGGSNAAVDLAPHPDPEPVEGLAGVRGLGCGGEHACALVTEGGVACWGSNSLGQLARPDAGVASSVAGLTAFALPSPPVQIAAGQFHTCALLQEGTVWCWGEDDAGQLGRVLDGGITQDPRPAPIPGLADARSIAAGNFHSCAVLGGGSAVCWGRNDHGQTGRGPGGATVEPSPAIVALPSGSKVAQIGAGLLHTCALLDDGSVWCWGANQVGQVGRGAPAADAGAPSGAAGAAEAGAVLDGGPLSADAGPPFNPADVLSPMRVTLSGPAVAVGVGYAHSCALLDGGAVECWGSNQFGELGGGSSGVATTDSLAHPVPEPVSLH